MIKHIAILIFSISFFGSSVYSSNQVIKKANQYYEAGKIVVKFKNEELLKKAAPSNAALSKRFALLGFSEIETFYSGAKGESSEAIKSIAVLKSYSPLEVDFLISKLQKLKEIEWAEPYYLYPLALTPDDPKFTDGTQWHLKNIEAEAAWNVSQGSADVIIGIIDTGVDWDHPDLQANIWENDDPVNGRDDDGNGYVDDHFGWDFGGEEGIPDNDPNEDNPDHGTHVAGIASAVTNNGIGIASIGYNCKIMPVKVSQNDVRDENGTALVSYGYQGIIYAVDNGADIINCSWGSSSFSSLGEEVVEYALANGSLIVGAAGNEDNNSIIYPAGYNGVLSVGAVNIEDIRSSYSNYGKNMDVVAPGGDWAGRIYSTWKDDVYLQVIGTSMAAPLTAGLAGLVKSAAPALHPLQIAEQIRVNTDNIYDLNHTDFSNLLGSGRINARKAITNFNSVSVRAANFAIEEEGNENGVLESGESFRLRVEFINILNSLSGLKITLKSQSDFLTVLNPQIVTGSINSAEVFSNAGNEFIVEISESAPDNAEADFILEFEQADYSDYQWLSTIDVITINPTYVNQNANKINFTIASAGVFAFNDYPHNQQGTGFSYGDGPNLLFEGALMYGTDENHLMDGARILEKQSSDFSSILSPKIIVNSPTADTEVYSVFNDDGADVNQLNIETHLRSYAFSDDANNQFILLDFNFINKSEEDINNFYAGIFYDWDIGISGQGDFTSFNTNQNFAYAFNSEGIPVSTYVGSALVSSTKYKFNAINNDGGNNSVNIYDGFTDTEKWNSISGVEIKSSSDTGDISFVIAGGPFQIDKEDTLKVGFSIGAAGNLTALTNVIVKSREKYSALILGNNGAENIFAYQLKHNYPNPFNNTSNIEFILKETENVSLKVYDILGREVAELIKNEVFEGETLHTEIFNAGKFNLASGVYFYRLTTENFSDTKKMVYLK